jgi:hypothetical protein
MTRVAVELSEVMELTQLFIKMLEKPGKYIGGKIHIHIKGDKMGRDSAPGEIDMEGIIKNIEKSDMPTETIHVTIDVDGKEKDVSFPISPVSLKALFEDVYKLREPEKNYIEIQK